MILGRAGFGLLLAVLLADCVTPTTTSARIDQLDAESADLLRGAGRLTIQWQQADQEYRSAEARLHHAAELWHAAGNDYEVAASEFRDATTGYRVLTVAVVVVAMTSIVGRGICAESMTTRQFRRQLEHEGVDLTGIDIDHAWPRALGGADNAANFQPLAASLNRSLGASVATKFATMPLATLQGLAVSAIAALAC